MMGYAMMTCSPSACTALAGERSKVANGMADRGARHRYAASYAAGKL